MEKNKENIKNALLGMKLSRKESEIIKGGAISIASGSVSVGTTSINSASAVSISPTTVSSANAVSFGAVSMGCIAGAGDIGVTACFCLQTCTECVTTQCLTCTHAMCKSAADTGNTGGW